MKLIKRFSVDGRNPDFNDGEVENMINEKLVDLQTNEKGERNEVELVDIKQLNMDSGILYFILIYEDKGLDVKQ